MKNSNYTVRTRTRNLPACSGAATKCTTAYTRQAIEHNKIYDEEMKRRAFAVPTNDVTNPVNLPSFCFTQNVLFILNFL